MHAEAETTEMPMPPRWHPNPHNGEPKDYYRYGVETRAYLRTWVDVALSEANREYRLARLAAAVGLTPGFLTLYLEGRSSLGWGLQEVLNDWASVHADIALNRPTHDTTLYTHLGDLG